ncbi:hypothetical protein WA538_004947, partial [Blastocystis sp. DL]
MRRQIGTGQRYLLLECLQRIKLPAIWQYLYSHGLLSILLKYLKDNNDLISDYDYIFTLFSVMDSIPTPQSLHMDPLPCDMEALLSPFCCCGDPDIEDLSTHILSR